MHNLEITNGEASFWARESAWHKLGNITGDFATAIEALENSKQNFEVSKEALINPRALIEFIKGNPNTKLSTLHKRLSEFEAEKAFGIFRNDNNAMLSSVGDRYTPIQNVFQFEIIDAILGEGGKHYETAGVLGKGEKVFVCAKVDSFEIGEGDKIDTYLVATASHDGVNKFEIKLTTTRVVCENTLNFALNGVGASVFAKHTVNAESKLREAVSVWNSVKDTQENIKTQFETLAKRQVNAKQVSIILDSVFKVSEKVRLANEVSTKIQNNIDNVFELFESNDNNAYKATRGTAWNLNNALTEWADHFRHVKAKDRDVDIVRAESAMFGTADKFKREAFELVSELTENCKIREIEKTQISVNADFLFNK